MLPVPGFQSFWVVSTIPFYAIDCNHKGCRNSEQIFWIARFDLILDLQVKRTVCSAMSCPCPSLVLAMLPLPLPVPPLALHNLNSTAPCCYLFSDSPDLPSSSFLVCSCQSCAPRYQDRSSGETIIPPSPKSHARQLFYPEDDALVNAFPYVAWKRFLQL